MWYINDTYKTANPNPTTTSLWGWIGISVTLMNTQFLEWSSFNYFINCPQVDSLPSHSCSKPRLWIPLAIPSWQSQTRKRLLATLHAPWRCWIWLELLNVSVTRHALSKSLQNSLLLQKVSRTHSYLHPNIIWLRRRIDRRQGHIP